MPGPAVVRHYAGRAFGSRGFRNSSAVSSRRGRLSFQIGSIQMKRESLEIPTLIAVSGPLAGQIFPLAAARLAIGRDPANDVQLRDLAASRHHAAIEARDGRLLLRDLESRRGTFVNGV